MKKRNALICHTILQGMLQDKMTVATAMSISKVLTHLEKVRKDHDAQIETVLKTVEGFEAYRTARQAIIANSQRNQGNRQIQQETAEKLKELDMSNPTIITAVRALDAEIEKTIDEDLDISFPKLELPPEMQIEGAKLVELCRSGLI